MHDPALRQLIAAAVAEAQRPLVAELAELRAELVQFHAQPRARWNPSNGNANPPAPVHAPDLGAQSTERGRLLRAKDVGMSNREWLGAIHRGELRATKIGRAYLVTETDFEAFLSRREVAPRPRRRRNHRADPATAMVERALAAGQLRSTTPKRKR